MSVFPHERTEDRNQISLSVNCCRLIVGSREQPRNNRGRPVAAEQLRKDSGASIGGKNGGREICAERLRWRHMEEGQDVVKLRGNRNRIGSAPKSLASGAPLSCFRSLPCNGIGVVLQGGITSLYNGSSTTKIQEFPTISHVRPLLSSLWRDVWTDARLRAMEERRRLSARSHATGVWKACHCNLRRRFR